MKKIIIILLLLFLNFLYW